jgi:PKD repeat protein
MGIWTVRVTALSGSSLPERLDGRRAALNPAKRDFTPAQFFLQPLLRVDGVTAGGGTCPEIVSLARISGCAPGDVQFRAVFGGTLTNILDATWDFGDGTQEVVSGASLVNPLTKTHPYQVAGPVTARLTIGRTGATCASSTDDAMVEVPACAGGTCPEIVSPPVVYGCVPGDVVLEATFGGTVANILEVRWDFGDGTPDEIVQGGAITNPLRTTHSYASSESVTARVTIVRSGCSSMISPNVSVNVPVCPVPDAVCPTLDPLEILSGCAAATDSSAPREEVVVRVRISGNLALASELNLSWGDGSYDTVAPPNIQASQDFRHTYQEVPADRMVATLERSADRCRLHVDAPPQEVPVPTCPTDACPELYGIAVGGCPGRDTVTLKADVSNPGLVEQYDWDFGDGRQTTGGPSVSHDYAERKDYEARVTIRRPARCDPRELPTRNTVSACAEPPPSATCGRLMVLAILGVVIGALLLGVGICLASFLVKYGAYWWLIGVAIAVLGAALLIAGNLALLTWLALCGSCPENCVLLDILVDVLLFLVGISALIAVLASLLKVFGISEWCFLGWLLDFLNFTFLLALAVWYSRFVGCSAWPRWVPGWGQFRIPDALRTACEFLSEGPFGRLDGAFVGTAVRSPGWLRQTGHAFTAATKTAAAVLRGGGT